MIWRKRPVAHLRTSPIRQKKAYLPTLHLKPSVVKTLFHEQTETLPLLTVIDSGFQKNPLTLVLRNKFINR